MYEVACHRVLRAHIRGFKTNTSNCTSKLCLLTEDSFTSTPPHARPPPAVYLTSLSVLVADLAPVLLLGIGSFNSDIQVHNAIYTQEDE
ncbi:uncharacterized [Lates japonicus]